MNQLSVNSLFLISSLIGFIILLWLLNYLNELETSDFTDSNLSDGTFFNSQLRDSIFKDANLTNCVFENVDLTGSDFTHANLTNTKFINCVLTDVKFDPQAKPVIVNPDLN